MDRIVAAACRRRSMAWMALAISPAGARLAPRPSRASMTRSGLRGAGSISRCGTRPAWRAAASACAASEPVLGSGPARRTSTVHPSAARCRAATSPSPPLLPGPAKTTAWRPKGWIASARRATASPARSISVCGGCIDSAAASARRLEGASCTGQSWEVGSTGSMAPTLSRPRAASLCPFTSAGRAPAARRRCPDPSSPAARRAVARRRRPWSSRARRGRC